MTARRRPRNQATPRINFGTGVTWSAVSSIFDEATVDNIHVPLEVRIMAAARARIDPTGHAHWRRGELRARLVVLTSTGEFTAVDRHTVTRAITRLVRAKILLTGSSPTCLVYVPFAVQTAIRNGVWPPCPRHGEDL